MVEKYPANIRSYLEKELEYVSAFVPNNYAYKIPENAFWGSYIVCEKEKGEG